ncbi:MAG: maleylpyruvate isomerase family mycothiol-dependent enzyme [Microthrixaceae bacterium]
MELSSVRVRGAFKEATDFLVEIVDSVGDDEWDRPALGVWNVAQLAVHASRGASTIVTYAADTAELTLDSAAGYYSTAMALDDINEAVAARAVEQTAAVEGSVADYVRAAVNEATEVLSRTPADQVLASPVGGIRLIDYLPTRIVEVVVHGLDLADALGREVEVPATAMAITLETLGDLAVVRPDMVDPARIVRAITGRGALPESANLLG